MASSVPTAISAGGFPVGKPARLAKEQGRVPFHQKDRLNQIYVNDEMADMLSELLQGQSSVQAVQRNSCE